jgi:hypothetical protein
MLLLKRNALVGSRTSESEFDSLFSAIDLKHWCDGFHRVSNLTPNGQRRLLFKKQAATSPPPIEHCDSHKEQSMNACTGGILPQGPAQVSRNDAATPQMSAVLVETIHPCLYHFLLGTEFYSQIDFAYHINIY